MSSFGRWAKLVRATVVIENGKHAIISRPNLSFDDFNRAGRISINRILHWLTASRIAAYYTPAAQQPPGGEKFLEYERMTSDLFTFMASTRAVVEPTFYKHIERADLPPLDIRLHLGYVGSASLNSVATLVTRDTGIKLATNVNQVVLVDKLTHKPIAVPPWWKQKYSSAIIGNERLIIRRFDAPTHSVHRYVMRVTWSDTDSYQHTNYESYIRFCLDAAMDAVRKNFYAGFSCDILRYDVAIIENLYVGESVAGEELLIDTWQDTKRPRRVFFNIHSSGKTVFQSSMEFHEPSGS